MKEGADKSKHVRATIGYLDSDGDYTPATAITPIPINIKSATGAFTSPWKLNWEDIYETLVTGKVTDEDKMFDNNLTTYGEFSLVSDFSLPAYYAVKPNIPSYVESVVLIVKDETDTLDVVILYYEDMTYDTFNLVRTDLGSGYVLYSANTNTDKRCISIVVQKNGVSGQTVTYNAKVHGLYIYINPHKVMYDIWKALYNSTDAASAYDKLKSLDTKADVNLSQAGQQYLYNSTDAKSVYDRLVDILNQLDVALSTRASETTLSNILSQLDVALSTRASETTLSSIDNKLNKYYINEIQITPWDTGTVSDTLLIADTAKPATPQVSETNSFPAQDSAGVTLYGATAVIQIKKFAGRIELNFSNTDTVNAQTVYYEVYVDGVLAVDNSAGTSIAAGGTLNAVHTITQTDPSDGDVTVEVYIWTSTANTIQLDSHRVWMSVGTESTTEDDVININRDGIQTIAMSFDTTNFAGATSAPDYTWVGRSQTSGVRINYLTNDDFYASDLLPKMKIGLYVGTSGEYAYVTGITAIKKEV